MQSVIHTSITDHYMTAVNWKVSETHKSSKPPSVLKLINKNKVNKMIQEFDWSPVEDSTDPNECATKFVKIITDIVSCCSTTKRISNKCARLKPWISQGLINSIRHRDKISRRVKCQPFNTDLSQYFKRYRNMLNVLLKSAKENYYRDKICLF